MSNKPFDKAYVLNLTVENIHSTIDFSTRRTMFRNAEFEDNPEKQQELMDTLAALTTLHKLIDGFVENNPHLFDKENKNEPEKADR